VILLPARRLELGELLNHLDVLLSLADGPIRYSNALSDSAGGVRLLRATW